MSDRPDLPARRNPMLQEEHAPPHEILVERRCLGQTELKVKAGQVGTSNATKLENLGVLDYAHLRAPLPKDLSGSGIFAKGANRKWPEAYFLMRRSSDGFVSATGMFKAAFPFAQVEEEAAEKEYIKELDEASSEEVAGNVWIDASKALELAEEYGIKLWIAALLDPEPITHGASDPHKAIKSPPPFHMREMANGIGRSPEKSSDKGTGRRSARARSLRSVSPAATKPKTTPRKIATATPRKGRKGRGALADVNEDVTKEEQSVNGDSKDTVKVEVEKAIVPGSSGEEEEESIKAKITMPANNPDLKIPDDPQEMLAQARRMVNEAGKIDSSSRGKRKAAEILDEDSAAGPSRASKRQKPVEVELRKERIKRRALTGIAASLAIGALIPSIMNAFPWA